MLVVSSETARRDVNDFCGRTENVYTLPFAMVPQPDWFERNSDDVARKYKLQERFVIFPSQLYRHKNHETLIRALAILKKRNCDSISLVLTGLPEDKRDPCHAPVFFA